MRGVVWASPFLRSSFVPLLNPEFRAALNKPNAWNRLVKGMLEFSQKFNFGLITFGPLSCNFGK